MAGSESLLLIETRDSYTRQGYSTSQGTLEKGLHNIIEHGVIPNPFSEIIYLQLDNL